MTAGATAKRFNFPSGGNVTIDGCHHEKSKHDYDGAQPSRIFFDQVEQFTESMFWYIALSRSRSKMGGSTSVLASRAKDREGLKRIALCEDPLKVLLISRARHWGPAEDEEEGDPE